MQKYILGYYSHALIHQGVTNSVDYAIDLFGSELQESFVASFNGLSMPAGLSMISYFSLEQNLKKYYYDKGNSSLSPVQKALCLAPSVIYTAASYGFEDLIGTDPATQIVVNSMMGLTSYVVSHQIEDYCLGLNSD
ncbi:MAG: hypothetical protein DGJ47_000483 [Rickettsiaceae bacterium]